MPTGKTASSWLTWICLLIAGVGIVLALYTPHHIEQNRQEQSGTTVVDSQP